jgi:signal transduction histidine kinase
MHVLPRNFHPGFAFWGGQGMQRAIESAAVLVPRKSLSSRFVFAVAIVVIATTLRYFLGVSFGITGIFMLYHPAVFIGAWYGRFSGGCIATILSAAVARILWIEPRFTFRGTGADEVVTVLLFVGIGIFQSFLIEIFQRSVLAQKEAKEELAKAREQLRHYADNLEIKVAERTAELRESVSELESMSYTLVHDLRAPLRAMRGFALALEDDYAGKLDAPAKDYLHRISKASSRMDDLIQDVLALGSVIRLPVKMETVNLESLVDDIIEDYPHLDVSHAEYLIDRPLHSVHGNRALLVQCISNLLGNAVKFVKAGQKVTVRIWTKKSGQKIRFNIRDNGIGIPVSLHRRIFEPFQRGHPELPVEGTGIGLTVVKKAAERMGGQIGVESEAGKGSRFWIELDAAR